MPFIRQIHCEFPPHYYDQERLIGELKKYWEKNYYNPARLEDLQRKVMVGGRYLSLPLEEYANCSTFEAKNNAWIETATLLGTKAIASLLEKASMAPSDIHLLASHTVTGISVPTLEARIMNRISFSPQTKRMPLFGLGCLAGVAGLNRVADYLKGHPTEAAIFLTVELCSLTLQFQDLSIPNLVASGLFGDGCAAVLMLGDEHPLRESSPLEWKQYESFFFHQTERVMGWDVVDSGFKIVLSADVPSMARNHLPRLVEKFLAKNDLKYSDLSFYLFHPGGPKVLQAMQEGLHLDPEHLRLSWKTLKEFGNISSVSVLLVIEEFLRPETVTENKKPGAKGLALAMGPGFCAEWTLLKLS